MSNKLEPEPIFKIGTPVEVTSNEDGFKNSWYKCKIIRPPKSKQSSTDQKRKKNFFWVEYETILEEDDRSRHLTEYVEASFIRHLPPTTTTCKQMKFERFDFVEANLRDGWWVGVILDVINHGVKYLVGFVSPYDEIEFSIDELRPHFRWVGGNKWIRPKKKSPVVRSPEDGSETVVALLLESLSTQVSAMEKTRSPVKRLKQVTSNDAKGKRSPGSRNDVQAPAAPSLLLESCPLSSSEGNTKGALKLSDMHSNCSMLLNPIIGTNKQNDGNSSKKKKRVKSPRSAVQKFLNSLQIGEQNGESGVMHDSVIEQSSTIDPAGEKLRDSGNMHDNAIEHSPTSDRAGEELEKSGTVLGNAIEQSPTSDPAGDCQRKALTVYSSPEWSILHNAALGANQQTYQSQSLPFTKRSETWKVIESMEVFKRFPQLPHFSPLNEHEENAREMLAICMMLKFAYEVETVTTRSDILGSRKTIHASLDKFKEMESHGFSTVRFQVYLNQLLEKVEAVKELQESLAKVESEIKEFQVEKSGAERKLCELVEQMKSLEEQMKSEISMKNLKEQQLSELDSRRGIIFEELLIAQRTKKALAFE